MGKIKEQLKGNSLYLVVFVIGIILFRLLLIADIPLLDKTEARYSEIARLMVETNDWIVLQIDYGVPFWAKPPLSTWLSALSFKIFGVNAFAARLPSYLLSLLLILILAKSFIKDFKSSFLIAFILLTMPEFLLHTGVVSTDTALCFSISIIMLSFWKAMNASGPWYWKYLFFVGIALGFLSKGPLVLVLTGPPIFFWLIVQKIKIRSLLKNLPWLIGILITAILAIPWYLLAEKNSPGFIDYFIVGEHFKRFVEPEWQGDLYGAPKSQALGLIWVFLFIFAFPWIQIVLYKLWKTRKSILKDSWLTYLVFWMLWTPVFFTISKNILHTYILPATVPLALIVIYFWKEYKHKKLALSLASIFPIAAFIFFFGIRFTKLWKQELNTDKYLLNTIESNTAPVLFWQRISYSSEFYTEGRAQLIQDETELDAMKDQHDALYFLIENKRKKNLPSEILMQMKLIDSNKKRSIYQFDKSQLK